jgi:coenzyme F420 hydrogenase subunit beta
MPIRNFQVQSVESVVQTGLCTGCGLCVAVMPEHALQMQYSTDGFLRPLTQTQCAKKTGSPNLDDYCPAIRIAHDANSDNYNALWGPLIKVRTGHSTDQEIRKNGSSGGVITAIAAYLLANKRVDFVAQIAVSKDDPLRNELQTSVSRQDVMRAAGSRYSPSAPLAQLRELLARGQRFAFVGKPCDVAALRNYAKHDARVDALIPYMLSFMCAGIPSLNGTHQLLAKMGVDAKQLASFRYRGDGWPGKARAVTHDGKVFETDYNSSWGTVLNRHLQFRCKICPDGTGEFADIVCADAWYGKGGYPDFTEREGRSLILSRTGKGDALVAEMMAMGALSAEPLPVADIALMQPYQANRKRLTISRLAALYLGFRKAPQFTGLHLWECAKQIGILAHLRSMLGTLRRLPK